MMRSIGSFVLAVGGIALGVFALVSLFPKNAEVHPSAPSASPQPKVWSEAQRAAFDQAVEAKNKEIAAAVKKEALAATKQTKFEGEKCDKRGMRIFPPGRGARSYEHTCCGDNSPRIGMSSRDVDGTCWPRPIDERRYSSALGTTVIRTYAVRTYSSNKMDLTFFNGVLQSVYERL